MRGDNAKVINPEPKAQRVKRRRARVANACSIIEAQLETARSGSYIKREAALRRMLDTLLLCLPRELSREKREDFVLRFLDCSYNEGDDCYDMPDVSWDGDLVSLHGNFSLQKLAKKFQW